ncbi:MAG TPA: DUF1501 domain-containing protein [Flavobacteriales bacterium]|nr:DUF1501 domain-containing protein [Flavobacteriales bacterium]
MNRREFIRKTSLATGALLVPQFLKAFELGDETLPEGYRNLVVVQLSGGNDALNTVVPYTNDVYYKLRSGIHIKHKDVLSLTDEQALNPALAAFKKLYDKGYVAIINAVGYPNPDRSHFRSMDIWHTASDSNKYVSTGWIGRYLDSTCNGCGKPHGAIEVNDTLSLALKGETVKGLSVKEVNRLYQATREPFFRELAKPDNMLDENNLGYLYKTLAETESSAGYIYETSKLYTNNHTYPAGEFGRQLKSIATFIQSGMQTRVYYISHGSFDTHVGQPGKHERLLETLGEGINAFIEDLEKTNKLNDTLVMVFSEFGRRVEQNASNGTDHGTAGNMFIIGNKLKKSGVRNAAPDLTDLQDGDLKHTVDFRSVYATVLKNWLGANDKEILGENFTMLDFI